MADLLCNRCKKRPKLVNHRWCAECRQARIDYITKYRNDNRETVRQYGRWHRRSNSFNRAAHNKTQANLRTRIRDGNGSVRQFLSSIIRSAQRQTGRRHRVPFEIDADFLVRLWEQQAGRCALSGLKMALRKHDLKAASVDRHDNTQGYTETNAQLVCRWANMAKGNRPDHEIRTIISELSIKDKS